MNTGASASIIALLEREFKRRLTKNARYSQRAFAKFLGTSQSILSLILAGKRHPTRKFVEKVAARLGLSQKQRELLLLEQAQRQAYSLGALDSRIPADPLAQDQLEMLSDWVCFAILSLLETSDAKFEPEWIAQRLGISSAQAKVSMQLLQRLGRVEEKNGKWRQAGFTIQVPQASVAPEALRKFHLSLLRKAEESLDLDPWEIRDASGIMFAMDPELVPYAFEEIRKFRRYLGEKLETMRPPTEVYTLNIQLFPLSQVAGRKKILD